MSGGVGIITPGPSVKMWSIANEAANKYYIECMDLRGYQVVIEKETK